MLRFTPVSAVAVSLLFSGLTSAQISVATDPVGFVQPFNTSANQINLLANSDTLVSVPFTRTPAFVGTIDSISGNVVTLAGSPGFTTNQFVYAQGTQSNHYYALIGPSSSANPKEGHSYLITANDSTTATLDTSHDDLSGIPADTQILIIPYWTLATVFPATDANVSFTQTTAIRAFKTEVLVPNYNAAGTNQAFSAVYFFSNNVNGSTNNVGRRSNNVKVSANNVGWRIVGDNTTPHDDDILLPGGYFVVRNLNGAPGLTLTTTGAVLTKKFAVPLSTLSTGLQDNSVAMIRPIAVTLNNTGLGPSDGSFVATTATRTFQDELLLFNNGVAALNRAPSAVYFYSNNVNGTVNNVGWRIVGDNTTDHGNDVIAAGSAIIIRKAATATGGIVFWTNAPTF